MLILLLRMTCVARKPIENNKTKKEKHLSRFTIVPHKDHICKKLMQMHFPLLTLDNLKLSTRYKKEKAAYTQTS